MTACHRKRKKSQGQTANSGLPARIHARNLLHLGVNGDCLPSLAQSLKARQPTAGCLHAYMQETCYI